MTRVLLNGEYFYGDILESIDSSISLLCALSAEKITIPLIGTYTVETTSDDYLNTYVTTIKSVRGNPIFTSEDYEAIKNARDVEMKYREIYALRVMGLKGSSITEVKVNECRQTFINIAEEEYINNMALIESDDDLSEQEKQIVRDSFLQEKHAFCEFYNKLDTVLDMFSNIPGNFFSEKLKYAITVKTILEREENLPSYV